MLVQKFTGLQEIDPEFISGIEELLENEFSSYEEFEKWVQKAPTNMHFYFYLFFTPQKNSPVGFAMLQMTKIERVTKKLFGLRKKIDHDLYLNWSIPGNSEQAIAYDQVFEHEIMQAFKKIRKEFETRENVLHESIQLPKNFIENDLEQSGFTIGPWVNIITPIKKTFNSIINWLESINLNLETQQEELTQVLKSQRLALSIHENFKDVFRNHPQGSDLYVNYRQLPQLDSIKKQDGKIICLWKNKQPEIFIGLMPSKNKKCFLRFINLHDETDKILERNLLFLAIDQFYHEDNFNELILNSKEFKNETLEYFKIESRQTISAKLDGSLKVTIPA